jgi:hypothetical protein
MRCMTDGLNTQGLLLRKSRRPAVALDCRELGRKLVVSCE